MLNCTLVGLTAMLSSASQHNLVLYSSRQSFSVHRSSFRKSFSTVFNAQANFLSMKFSSSNFEKILGSGIRLSSVIIQESEFSERQIFDNGGAKEQISIDSCMFRDCLCTGSETDGGAIYVQFQSSYAQLSIVRSSFYHCRTTDGCGGAICSWSNNLYLLETCFSACSTSSDVKVDKNSGASVYSLTSKAATICGCSFTNSPGNFDEILSLESQNIAVMLASGAQDLDDCNFSNNYYTSGCSALSMIASSHAEITYVGFTNNTGPITVQIHDPTSHKLEYCNFVRNNLNVGSDTSYGFIEYNVAMKISDFMFQVYDTSETNRILSGGFSTDQVVTEFIDCNFDLTMSQYVCLHGTYKFYDDCKFEYDGPINRISVFNSEECWFIEPERHPAGAHSYLYLVFGAMLVTVISYGLYLQFKSVFIGEDIAQQTEISAYDAVPDVSAH